LVFLARGAKAVGWLFPLLLPPPGLQDKVPNRAADAAAPEMVLINFLLDVDLIFFPINF
jgi:hypothetical protein